MTDQVKITTAELHELDPDGEEAKDKKNTLYVQFNPETLKVSFANQIKPSGDQKDTSGWLYVGKGSTKLGVQLWFDVTAPLRNEYRGIRDVRELTKKVAYFITPGTAHDTAKELYYAPPGVRFIWGTFQFDGIMESLEESLEFFSPDGRPLRASVQISLTQQKIDFTIRKQPAGQPQGAGLPGGAPPGTSPLTEAAAGSSLQKLAAGMGQAEKWQRIAQNNGIENPRVLSPGQLIDMGVPGLKR
jgi:Contractile injection system tube protein